MQPREQVDTGVDVGSNETASARTSAEPGRPGRGRVRPLAARAAAAFLVAFAALLALPLQAQAQTVVTLVNSLSQTEGQSSTALGNNWEVAQGFTTGSNADGYTLTNIRSVFPSILNNMPSLTVTLHKDAPTNAAIATLTNPATIEVGQLTFTAPANTTLDAATTYYVLFHGENIWLESTTSDDEDTNGLSDWSVEDVRYRRDDRTTGPFTEVAVSTPIRVRGTVDVATPTVSISADKTTAVFKEDGITYTLTRTGSTTAALDVSISLSQPDGKDFLLAADLPQTVTIAAGQSTNTFTIAASSFQHFAAGTMVEAGTLTAVVEDEDGPGGDYDLGTPFSVNVAIVIGMTVRFDMASYSVGEADGTLPFMLIARTGAGAPRPTADYSLGEYYTDATNGTALLNVDFNESSSALIFPVGDFSASGGVWQAEQAFSIAINEDALDEDDETFDILLERRFSNSSISVVDASGNSCGSVCTVTVTIVDDDGTPAVVDDDEVWSGTLTVRDLGSGVHGCSNFVTSSLCSSRLSDDDFTHDGTNYPIVFIFLRTNGQLEIDFDTDLTTATQGLTLNVDGTAFAFEDASSKLASFRRWNNTGLSWTAGNTVSLTLTEPTTAVRPPPALSIADASAAENAGHLLFDVTLSRSLRNTVKVDFETISGGTATEGVDYYARRTYTHVILAGDKTAQMGFALIEDTVNEVDETVQVRLSNARVVDAYGDKIKDLDITRAEATGTITAPPTTTTTVPGLTIRIRDATRDEASGWLDFRVRLSRKHDDYVCYDFESISGGTATEGTDYLKFPKATYWMQIGKRVDKPVVRIIDDSVNDNGETVKVKISNAHVCGDPSQTVSITRAEATGTIRNSDPLPRALMARFGRTAAVHVVEHVEERLAAPREVGVEAQVAGRQLRPGMARELALDVLRQLGSSAGMHAPGAGSPGARSGPPMGEAAGSLGLAAGMGGPAGGGMGVAADPMNGMAGPDGGLFDRGLRSMGLGGEHLLTNSSFALTRETRQGGILSFWSRGARSSFAGREEALSLGGDVRTTMVGADYAKGPLVTGLSLSNSRGLGEYAGVTAGQVASAVTGLYPWLGYTLSDRVSVWGVTGYGKGALTLTPGEGAALTSGLSMAMAAAGTRGALVAGGASGFELAFKADALWVGTSIDGVEGPGGNLAATAAAVTRFRTGLEAARGYTLAGRLSLRPSVEVGLRHDGGDAETGAGLDVGGGLVVSDTSTGLAIDVRVRMLVMHQADGFSERGMALSLSYNPTPSTPLGLTARVAPSWGGQATSGAEAMWGRETMTGMAQRRRRRQATASRARSATGCRWGAASWGRRGSASVPRSTDGTIGSATASGCSTGSV